MERIVKRLNKEDSQLSVNKGFNVKIPLNNNNRLLVPNEINEMVNQYDEFQLERNRCKKYRFLGTIKTLFSNPLFEVNGDNNNEWVTTTNVNHWGIFDEFRFRDKTFPSNGSSIDEEDLTYKESFNTNLKEVDGWFGFYKPFDTQNPSNACKFEKMTPGNECFELTPTSGIPNWELIITYPHSIDSGHTIVNGGLLIIELTTIEIGNRQMNTLRTPVKHGLKVGDKVNINGLSPFNLNGDFKVKQLGYKDGTMGEYVFVVDTSSELINNIFNARMRRVMGSSGNNRRESIYYFRKFKRITDVNDYEVYPLSIAKNIYSDQTVQYVFNGGSGTTEDVDITYLSDNLSRPLSEVFLTIIKRHNLGFSKISSGIDIPYTDTINSMTNVSDIRRIHNGGLTPIVTHVPLELDIDFSQELFYGDVVEYNEFSLIENVLSEVSHRFNTNNREANGRQEGYLYNPHHRIQIRQFSSYIEQGDINVYGPPLYSTDLGDGRLLWRDLLSLGFSDTSTPPLDYPFTNGTHYLYKNIFLNVRRQDPFSLTDLYYQPTSPNDPRDPLGDPLDGDNYEIKRGCGGC